MTIEVRRVQRGVCALIATSVLLLLAAAPGARADTIYPVNQISGSSFDSGADSYATVSNGCRLLLGLLPTNDPATCQTQTAANTTVGNPPGSLEQSYQAVANALSPLLFDATAVASSPSFTVTTGGPTSFQVDRRADVLALLDLGTNATYTFTLVDESAANARQVLATENLTDSDNAFESVLNESLPSTISGHQYHIEVSTTFTTALLSVALGRMVVDFDNVRLRVKDGTSTFGAPTVVTDPASDISATGATLNGRVNANGLPTTFLYRYGLAPGSLTSTTGPFSGGTQSTAFSRPRAITGLTGCTTYYFRIEASNSDPASPSVGLTRSFRTDCQPTVTTLVATGVGADSATFNSRINPEGPETTYYYEYGTVASGAFGSRIPAAGSELTLPAGHSDSVPNSYPVGGLTPQTAYHVRVVANNSLGTSTGDPVTFTTIGTGAPGPPGGPGAPGAPGAPGGPGPSNPGTGSSGLGTILNLLSSDRRAILRIDGQRLIVPTRGRFKGRLRIRILCRPIAIRTCSGTVKVRTTKSINPDSTGKRGRKKTQVTFSTAPVQLDRRKIGYAILQFNDQRLALLKHLKSVRVEVIAALIDGANNRQNVRRNSTLVPKR